MMRFQTAAIWFVFLAGVIAMGGCVSMIEHDRVVTELTLLRQQQEETKAEHNREVQALTAKLKVAEADNKRLTKQVATLKEAIAHAERKDELQQKQIEKLQADLISKNAGLEKLDKAAKLQDKKIKDQAGEIQKLKDEIVLLKKAAAAAEKKTGDVEKIEPVESK